MKSVFYWQVKHMICKLSRRPIRATKSGIPSAMDIYLEVSDKQSNELSTLLVDATMKKPACNEPKAWGVRQEEASRVR